MWIRIFVRTSGICVFLVALAVPGQLRAQLNSGFEREGFQFSGASVSFGYSSFPISSASAAIGQTVSNTPSYVASASTGFAFYRTDLRGYLSIAYGASYYRRFDRYLSGLSQSLSITSSRQVSQNVRSSFSISGVDSNAEQFLTLPTQYASVVNAPATFDQLAGAMLNGTYTNDQLASLLTGAPVVQTPARELLYGGRVLSSRAHLGLQYTPSGRLSFSSSLGGTFTRRLNNSSLNSGLPVSLPLLNRTITANASLQMRYAMTPRTEIGISLTGSRIYSTVARLTPVTAMVNIGRRLNEHFFASADGGIGFVTGASGPAYTAPAPVASATRNFSRYMATGTFGYTNSSQGLVGSWSTSIADPFGLGGRYTENASAAWHWRRLGSNWTVSASGGHQRILGSSLFGPVTGWQAKVGAGRHLNRQLLLAASYSYYENGALAAAAGGAPTSTPVLSNNLKRYGTYITLTWSPGAGQAMPALGPR